MLANEMTKSFTRNIYGPNKSMHDTSRCFSQNCDSQISMFNDYLIEESEFFIDMLSFPQAIRSETRLSFLKCILILHSFHFSYPFKFVYTD